MSDILLTIREDIAADPAVVDAMQTIADATTAAIEKAAQTAALAAMPAPVAAIASLFMPALASLEAKLTAKMDAAIQSLKQAPVTTTPGSGVAGLVAISEVDAPAPAAAAAPVKPTNTLQRKQAERAAMGPTKPLADPTSTAAAGNTAASSPTNS